MEARVPKCHAVSLLQGQLVGTRSVGTSGWDGLVCMEALNASPGAT